MVFSCLLDIDSFFFEYITKFLIKNLFFLYNEFPFVIGYSTYESCPGLLYLFLYLDK